MAEKEHVMDWNNTRIIASESNKHKRCIKEAIEIRKWAQNTINWDEGAYMLSHTWDSLLQRPLGLLSDDSHATANISLLAHLQKFIHCNTVPQFCTKKSQPKYFIMP